MWYGPEIILNCMVKLTISTSRRRKKQMSLGNEVVREKLSLRGSLHAAQQADFHKPKHSTSGASVKRNLYIIEGYSHHSTPIHSNKGSIILPISKLSQSYFGGRAQCPTTSKNARAWDQKRLRIPSIETHQIPIITLILLNRYRHCMENPIF